MKYFIKDTIILLITLLIFLIILYNIFYKNKEGFNPKDIGGIVNDVKKVTKVVGDIPDEINNINKKLTEKIDNMGKQIEKNMTNVLTKKLGSIFTQIGDIFDKGLVQPILAVFKGFGNIFVQIFGILKEIGNKIVSLPSCIVIFMIKGTINTIEYFYSKMVPKFLRNILSFIYRYTLRYLFDFIGYITGFDDSVQRCYGFNVSSEVNKMSSSLTNVGDTFKNDFGRLDFSKIKI